MDFRALARKIFTGALEASLLKKSSQNTASLKNILSVGHKKYGYYLNIRL